MAQKPFFSLRYLALALTLGLAVSLAPLAQAEEAAAEAPAGAVAPVAAPTPAAATAPAPATKEEAAPAEKPLSDAEKQEAIAAADAVTLFDASKVIGAPKDWQIYFQEAVTPIKKTMKPLHDAVQIVITIITLFVLALLLYIVLRFNKRANPKPQTFTHNKTVEVIWTVIPILILVGIAIPSIRIHYDYYYNEQALTNPDLTIKVVGHQWYWNYEYPDQGIAFDSNMTKEEDLPEGAPRLLEVDNPVVVPVNKVVRVQLTAADVMHAWALPSFGVKKGAIPGRLNETWFKAEKEGIYYGQCSILCGKLHGYMPIKIVVVSEEQFEQWVKGAKLKFADSGAFQVASIH
jgi:cytochrome c oxidase subunit 2